MSYDAWKTRTPDDDPDGQSPSRVTVRCDDCNEEFLMAVEDLDGWPEDEPRRCDRCVRLSQVTLDEVWNRGGLKAS